MINRVAIAPGDRTVPWINQCYPEWSVKQLKYMTKINTRSLREDTESDFEINYIDISSVDSNGRQNPAEIMTFGDAPSRARRVITSGNVIISTVRTYLKAISYIENANDNLICSTGFAVITPSPQVHPKFLFYWVRSEWFVNEIVARSVGVSYPAINAIEIGNLPFPVIKLEEQQTIADFLDWETNRIDELITKKKRLIELLQEQRTALVTRAVTKGLNPNAPMKDSGVEWLGVIPSHWELKRLKYMTNLINDKVETEVIDLPYLGLENVESWTGRIIESENEMEPESTSNRFQQNDILFGKLRPYLAKVVHAVNDGICSSELIVLRTSNRCSPRFLFYYLVSRDTINIVNSATYGVKMPRANWKFIGNLPFLAIAVEEQQAIADYLDQETTRIDSLVSRINHAIEKLQEYRTALITAAVTGKIDLREHVS